MKILDVVFTCGLIGLVVGVFLGLWWSASANKLYLTELEAIICKQCSTEHSLTVHNGKVVCKCVTLQ
jgi:hypothetical protein